MPGPQDPLFTDLKANDPRLSERAIHRALAITRSTSQLPTLQRALMLAQIFDHYEPPLSPASVTRTRELPVPRTTPRARLASVQLVEHLRPEVEALRTAIFSTPAAPFPLRPPGGYAKRIVAALGQAAAWIDSQAASQARPSGRDFKATKGPLLEAERHARCAARRLGCEYAVALVPRYLDYLRPARAADPVKRAGGLAVASVPVRGPAMEVTAAEVLLAPAPGRERLTQEEKREKVCSRCHTRLMRIDFLPDSTQQDHLDPWCRACRIAELPKLWLLERRCRAWATTTDFTLPDLVAHVLTGVPLALSPVRLTITEPIHLPEIKPPGVMAWPRPQFTLTVLSEDVTEEKLLELVRRARKELRFHRRKPTSARNEKLVERVRRLGGPPTPFLKEAFWKPLTDPGKQWRGTANRYLRTVGPAAGLRATTRER
jgi:hypothetical protein